jgi:hypothetical protein
MTKKDHTTLFLTTITLVCVVLLLFSQIQLVHSYASPQLVHVKGTIRQNFVVDPNFSNLFNSWNSASEEKSWYSIDYSTFNSASSSLRVDLPVGPRTSSQGNPKYNPTGLVWTHIWNERIPVVPGQKIIIKGYVKTLSALGVIGFDLWNQTEGGVVTRGFRPDKVVYNTNWQQISLGDPANGDQPIVIEPGERAVIFWFEATKGENDFTTGQVWFDDPQLYIFG